MKTLERKPIWEIIVYKIKTFFFQTVKTAVDTILGPNQGLQVSLTVSDQNDHLM